MPSVNGIYADFINESPHLEKEIEGIGDFSSNIGYIVGPITAGFVADFFGDFNVFVFLGICGIIFAGILFIISPKSINVKRIEVSKMPKEKIKI